MAYPQEIDKFTEKLNKLDNNTYVMEEEVEVTDGVYEGELQHDNVSLPSINVYTGSKLTGQKIENVIVSTPSLTPWKNTIKIFSDVSPVYITYQTQGDTVEAEDINKVQDSVVNTQKEVDRYKDSNDNRVSNDEVRLTTVENNKAEKTYVDTELNKRYLKTETYNKTETDQRIQMVVDAAPEALDTLKEIADALNNDPDFAATITTQLAGKVDKVDGKQLSTEDYTSEEKDKLAGIEGGANNYVHPTTHPASMITEDSTHEFVEDGDISNWNDANSQKHTHNNFSILQTITQTLIDAWNTVSNKSDVGHKHANVIAQTILNMPPTKEAFMLTINKYYTSYANKIGVMQTWKHYKSNTIYFRVYNTDANTWTSWAQIALKSDIPSIPTKVSQLTNDGDGTSSFVTASQLGDAGYGDMTKATYDADNDGIVDNAEKISGIAISDIGQLSSTKTWTAKQNFNAGAPVQLANNIHPSSDLINTYPAGYSVFWLTAANGFPITTGYGFVVTFNIGTCGYQEVVEMYTGADTTVKQRRWFRTKRDSNNFWQPFQEILTSTKGCTWNDLKGV